MTDLDVVPVGRPPGASTVRRRGWVRVALGAAVVVAGTGATVAGIAEAVDTHGRIEGDAVARGTVATTSEPVRFRAEEAGDYTVYLIFPKGNVVNRELEEEAAVRSTACQVALPGGDTHSFRGSRQGAAQTIDRASTVGHFSTGPGAVRVHCAYGDGSRRTRRRRFDTVSYVVTPGRPTVAGGGTLLIVGGVFGAIGGGFLAGWGWRGRRRPI